MKNEMKSRNPSEASVDRALGFRGSRTKIQWVTHEASVQHAPGLSGVGVVCSSLRLSREILGNSRARRKILGVICREFWENLGF